MEAAQWYEDRSRGLGGEFLEELYDMMSLIEKHPHRFPIVEQGTGREMRAVTLSRFPYAVVYEIREKRCRIIAVAHAHRRPGYWRKRLHQPP
jgi:hypothetical protein